MCAQRQLHWGNRLYDYGTGLDFLDAPVLRVDAKNGIAPQSHIWKPLFLPNADDISAALWRWCKGGTYYATYYYHAQTGQTVEESTIVKWHKQVGDPVAKCDVLFEIETDKAVVVVESFFVGTLLAIVVKEGETVPVTAPVAFVGEPGEKIPAVTPPAAKPKPAPAAPPPAPGAPAPAAAASTEAVAATPGLLHRPCLRPQPQRRAFSPRTAIVEGNA